MSQQMPYILKLVEPPAQQQVVQPSMNPPTLPPPLERAVCGLRLHELPDLLAGAGGSGR
ncbi:MAG: hypothetical protein H7Y32_00215, partial [Chloroflexales bacterium]|nr:hypothetical protein [Chloroflexales bacterium]